MTAGRSFERYRVWTWSAGWLTHADSYAWWQIEYHCLAYAQSNLAFDAAAAGENDWEESPRVQCGTQLLVRPSLPAPRGREKREGGGE